MTENVANQRKEMDIQMEEMQLTLTNMNLKEVHAKTHYNPSVKSQSQTIKSSTRKKARHVHESFHDPLHGFLSRNLTGQWELHDIFTSLEEKKKILPLKILYLVKMSLKNEGNKQKLYLSQLHKSWGCSLSLDLF